MKHGLLLLFPFAVSAQCYNDASCNDNIPCTQEWCWNGYCNIIPLNDTCYNYTCFDVGHCKVLPYMIDSCGCVSIMRNLSIPFDSIEWWLDGNLISVTQNDTFCYPVVTGIHQVWVEVYINGVNHGRKRNFYLFNCIGLCTLNSDCNDNNPCTIDQCYKGQCRNQKGHSVLLSNVSKSWWGANCCCN